jgi:hypothetical protein
VLCSERVYWMFVSASCPAAANDTVFLANATLAQERLGAAIDGAVVDALDTSTAPVGVSSGAQVTAAVLKVDAGGGMEAISATGLTPDVGDEEGDDAQGGDGGDDDASEAAAFVDVGQFDMFDMSTCSMCPYCI